MNAKQRQALQIVLNEIEFSINVTPQSEEEEENIKQLEDAFEELHCLV